MREAPISHREAADLGWTRTDPKPWGKLAATWAGPSGWQLKHCGHPTANTPWILLDPEGRMVLTGAEREGEQADDGGPISRFEHGTCWWDLRAPMVWLQQELTSDPRRADMLSPAGNGAGGQPRREDPMKTTKTASKKTASKKTAASPEHKAKVQAALAGDIAAAQELDAETRARREQEALDAAAAAELSAKPAKAPKARALRIGDRVTYTQGKGTFDATVTSIEGDSVMIERASDGKYLTRSASKLGRGWQHSAKVAEAQDEAAVEDAPKAKRAPKAAAEKPARERDPRLPVAGTELTKRTSDGKTVSCIVGAGNGATYNGTEYSSLSSAAKAAAADLGLTTNQNGFLFWGLIKSSVASKNPVDAIESAWGRFEATATAAIAAAALAGPEASQAVAEKLGSLLGGFGERLAAK